MSEFQLVSTEKSYLVQQNNYYLIQFTDKRFTPNKIEVTKLLLKAGYDALAVKTVNQYKKRKRKGKQSNIVRVLRPKKYYVKLKPGQSIKAEQEDNNQLITNK
jgi:ribosomal protein L23